MGNLDTLPSTLFQHFVPLLIPIIYIVLAIPPRRSLKYAGTPESKLLDFQNFKKFLRVAVLIQKWAEFSKKIFWRVIF